MKIEELLDKIYNMDCLEGMKQIPDGTIDAVICDLPYGTTACAWDSVIPFDKLWEQYRRIVKPNGAIVLFGSEPFSTTLRASNLKEYRYDWVWEKEQGVNQYLCKVQPLRIVENVMVFYRETCTYNPQMSKGTAYVVNRTLGCDCYGEKKDVRTENKGERYPVNLLRFSRDLAEGERFHPTQKPVDLLRYLVLTYTNEGDTVLDNCMGSGTTAIACIKEKRHFIGFELNKDYYDKACKRIKNEQRQITINF